MSLPDLIRWLSADWTHAVTAAGLLALGYALAWAAIRASYERVVGRPMPRTRLVLVLDILADLAVNVPGAPTGSQAPPGATTVSPPPPAPRPPAAPSERSGEAGRAPPSPPPCSFRALGASRVCGVPAGARGRAPRHVPRVACAADTQRCHDGAPLRCARAPVGGGPRCRRKMTAPGGAAPTSRGVARGHRALRVALRW